MTQFLSNLLAAFKKSPRSRTTTKPTRRPRLGVESLEERQLMSASPLPTLAPDLGPAKVATMNPQVSILRASTATINQVGPTQVLGDTAVGSPATELFNGRQFIAWAGTNAAHNINVMALGGSKVVLGETTTTGVRLAVFYGRLYMTWAGGNQQINIMSSADGIHWSGKVVLGETCLGCPAISYDNGRLVLAWTGSDAAHHLNFMSSVDGQHWFDKFTSVETSIASPALTYFHESLTVAFTGTNSAHNLNVMYSASYGRTWYDKQVLTDTSSSGPALTCQDGDHLSLAWDGTDPGHHLNLMSSNDGNYFSHINLMSSNDGNYFSHKVTLQDASDQTPAVIQTGSGTVKVVWTGTNAQHNLNVKQVTFV